MKLDPYYVTHNLSPEKIRGSIANKIALSRDAIITGYAGPVNLLLTGCVSATVFERQVRSINLAIDSVLNERVDPFSHIIYIFELHKYFIDYNADSTELFLCITKFINLYLRGFHKHFYFDTEIVSPCKTHDERGRPVTR